VITLLQGLRATRETFGIPYTQAIPTIQVRVQASHLAVLESYRLILQRFCVVNELSIAEAANDQRSVNSITKVLSPMTSIILPLDALDTSQIAQNLVRQQKRRADTQRVLEQLQKSISGQGYVHAPEATRTADARRLVELQAMIDEFTINIDALQQYLATTTDNK
jgi:valyl-tRNA synthetase